MGWNKPSSGADSMPAEGTGNPDILASLGCLLAHVRGKKMSDCCVSIPSGHSLEMIGKHLALLSRQEEADFDVLIIGKCPESGYAGLNLLVYEEKYPLGSSGAFGLGQVTAYALGYEYIINADIDCFPVSRNLVKHLRETAEMTGKAVFPVSVFDSSGSLEKANKNYIVNHYGIVPRGIYRKFGFANFRFVKGGEDAELQGRLEMENAVAHDTEVVVEHRNLESNHIDAMLLMKNKYIYYSKNFIIANILLSGYALKTGRLISSARYFATTIYSLLLYWIIYNNYRDFLAPIFFDGLRLKMDCSYAPRSTRLKELPKGGHDKCTLLSIEGEGKEGLQFKPKTYLMGANRLAGVAYLAIMCGKVIFERATYLKMTDRFMDEYKFFIQYLILLKPLEYRDGKVYSEEMGPIRIGINALVFAIMLPVIVPIAIVDVFIAACQKTYPITEKNLKENIRAFHAQISRND